MFDFITAFLLIFVAEMGDKTQIMAMAFATRYKIKHILLGVALGSFLNHGLAIVFGSVFLRFVPIDALQLVAGVLFIAFGLLSLSIAEDKEESLNTKQYGAVATVALAFFLGELGDKTQLTALTLGAQAASPLMTLFGTVLGMVVVSSLGIFVGAKLGDKVPEPLIKSIAFVIFMGFGLNKIFRSEYVLSMGMTFSVLLLGVVAVLTLFRVVIFIRQIKEVSVSAWRERANALMHFKAHLKDNVDGMCNACASCKETVCLVGYMKSLLMDKHDAHLIDSSLFKSVEINHFDPLKAMRILEYIDAYYKQYPDEKINNIEVERVRVVLNHIVSNQSGIKINY